MKRGLLLGGLVGVNVVLGLALTMPAAKADTSYVSTATIDVPSACSLTATVDTAHNATLINGIYSGGNDYYPNGIGKTTLTAFCNDASGFAIYAVGFSGNEYGVTNMIGTNTGTTIPTGTATSGANSQWAMKLTKVTDTTAYNPANMTITNGYDDYSAVPDDYEKVANFSSATDQTLGSKLTTTYAAYIAQTQPADTYTGKVKYTLVHPSANIPNKPYACSPNKICYWPNAGDMSAGGVGVEDTMGDQSVGSTDTSATLWASNFRRPGYGFAGWSDAYDYVVNEGSESNPNAHIYGPNEDVEFTAGQYGTEGLSLYAVWVPSAGSIQNWTCPNNTTMPIGTVTALTDQRDNDTYAVAKLADGKCWMIENLRLDNTNTDNATGALSQGYGGQFIGLANPETANFTATNGKTDATTANSIYYAGTLVSPATVDIVQDDYAGYRMPRFRNDNTNTDDIINPNTTVAYMTDINQNVYGYGNYYTWSAAKANTGYINDISNSNATLTSICPKGWRLPQGGNKTNESTNEFWFLVVTGLNNPNPASYEDSASSYYTGVEEASPVDKKLRIFPNNFVYSGNVVNSSVSSKNGWAFYWSATADSQYNAYYFSFRSAVVYPGTGIAGKYHGRSVRCVLSSSN